MPERTLSYEVVLVRCDRYVIASIGELNIQVAAAGESEAIEAARRSALRVLATCEEEGGRAPEPVEKMLATIEVPRPTPVRCPRDRGHLRMVKTARVGRR